MLDLRNAKWYSEDKDTDISDFIQNIESETFFALSDDGGNGLKCRKIDILELYRRLYVVLRPNKPIDDFITPNTLVFRAKKEDGKLCLRFETNIDAFRDVVCESIKRIAKGTDEKKSFKHLFQGDESAQSVYDMLIDGPDNPEGAIWFTEDDGRKQKFTVDDSFRMRDTLYCLLSPLNGDGSGDTDGMNVYYVDESEGEPKLRRENDEEIADKAYDEHLNKIDALSLPTTRMMWGMLESQYPGEDFGFSDEGDKYLYGCCINAPILVDEDGEEYVDSDIRNILYEKDLPGPMSLLYNDKYIFEEIFEDKIGTIRHERRLYLIAQPQRYVETGRTHIVDEDGEEYDSVDFDFENLGRLDVFSVKTNGENSTLRRLQDLSLKDTIYDKFLRSISGK